MLPFLRFRKKAHQWIGDRIDVCVDERILTA